MDNLKPTDSARSQIESGLNEANEARSEATERAFETGDSVVKRAMEASRAGVELAGQTARDNVDRARAQAKDVAGRSLEMGSQAMEAYVEAGKRASAKLADANRLLTESYGLALSDYSDLAQKAAGCRSVQDLIQLQTGALQKLHDNFDSMSRFYGLVVDAFTQSLEPLTPIRH